MRVSAAPSGVRRPHSLRLRTRLPPRLAFLLRTFQSLFQQSGSVLVGDGVRAAVARSEDSLVRRCCRRRDVERGCWLGTPLKLRVDSSYNSDCAKSRFLVIEIEPNVEFRVGRGADLLRLWSCLFGLHVLGGRVDVAEERRREMKGAMLKAEIPRDRVVDRNYCVGRAEACRTVRASRRR